jgi:hypothetical protein
MRRIHTDLISSNPCPVQTKAKRQQHLFQTQTYAYIGNSNFFHQTHKSKYLGLKIYRQIDAEFSVAYS